MKEHKQEVQARMKAASAAWAAHRDALVASTYYLPPGLR